MKFRHGQRIARLRPASMTEREKFFLRWLLQKIPARSFEDLRTVNGETYANFQDAARVRGLLGAQEETEEAMDELTKGEGGRVGKDLRSAFVTFLISSDINVSALVQKYYTKLTVDLRGSAPAVWNEFLEDLKDRLERMGSSLANVGLPEPKLSRTELQREQLRWDAEECKKEAKALKRQMNADVAREQRNLYNEIIRDVADWRQFSHTQKMLRRAPQYFVDAPQGRGKTTLARRLISRLRSQPGAVVLVAASTGLAALNYKGGYTAHSLFRIPVLDKEDDTEEFHCNVTGGSQRAELIRSAVAIIWDELPMARANSLDAVDEMLSDIMGDARPYI